MSTVWINGRLAAADEGCVSPFDHGLLVGDGVFETLAAFDGVPFAWTRHDDRLRRSAAALGFEPPPSPQLREAVEAVIAANALTDARVRITVTSGPGPLGSDRGDAGVTTLVAVSAPKPFAPTVDVAIAPWTRNERGALVGLKTISYAENVRALAWAKEQGAGEAILANTRGELCEGTGTNVYLVDGDRVVTPPLSSGCLDGVTRQLLLELCSRLGIPALEESRPLAALRDAQEAFLSSSTRGAHPIAHVDGRALPSVGGPVTSKLMAAYADLVASEPDP